MRVADREWFLSWVHSGLFVSHDNVHAETLIDAADAVCAAAVDALPELLKETKRLAQLERGALDRAAGRALLFVQELRGEIR